MSESAKDAEGNSKEEKDEVTWQTYVPGSSLAAIDAKMAKLDNMFKSMCRSAGRVMAYQLGEMPAPEPFSTSLISCATVDDIASHFRTCKNVIVLTGAGISTSAGIPDFRSPGSGVYDNVQKYLDKYQLQNAQKLFSYELFQEDPEPFYALAREMKYPNKNVQPTLAHYFIKLLSDKGVLLRNYTQNIDMLQSQTGIPDERVFEVHGSFRSGTCMECHVKLDKEQLKEAIFSGKVARCTGVTGNGVHGAVCSGVIKPDIVMFGESLPKDYLCSVGNDEGKCDLLIVMGTSLQVGPVNQIPNTIPPSTPRLLINMEKVCTSEADCNNLATPIFFFDHPDNKTDVFMGGDIDSSLVELTKKIGWWEELKEISGELGEVVEQLL